MIYIPDFFPTIRAVWIKYITEVKIGQSIGTLQSAIGQLITHQFIQQSQGHKGVMYQAVLSKIHEYERDFPGEFLKFLHELEIDVLFYNAR